MLIARWQIDAKFGQKQTVVDLIRRWGETIAPQIGFTADKGRMLTGSIGAREATVVHEWQVGGLAELEAAWSKLARIEAHAAWGAELEPHVVSGSSRWEIYRVL
ncbi:MAG: hypothetical protein ACM30I_08050 [Gemmatimonas sp.]